GLKPCSGFAHCLDGKKKGKVRPFFFLLIRPVLMVFAMASLTARPLRRALRWLKTLQWLRSLLRWKEKR
ncbi:hypothetical protein, partial [Halalkalibacter alkalisediminis]|uniref:hypothetical protein n=1 Tax=Halalkalibacter alkalisediminis TaxID=935616 RepID=UPI002362DAC3